MPRPPAKRGRVARQKAGRPQRLTKDPENSNPAPATETISVEIVKGEAFASGALRGTDSKQTRDASSTSLTKGTVNTTTSFANSSRRTKNHETPRTGRSSRETTSSRPPATASRQSTTKRQTLGSAIRRGDASSKIQRMTTPGFDSSMLSNFRRRPRQPSILHLMNDYDEEENREGGSSDLDSEAFLGGFDPDDESTPLDFSKRKTLPVDALPPTPSPRKKPAAPMPPPSSTKKRKLHAVEIPISRPVATEDDNDDAVEDTSENESVPLPELPAREPSPEVLSQTMAPPVSSSVVGSPGKGRLEENARPRSAKERHISTATLRQNLLPTRRHRREKRQRTGMDVFDLVSDEDDTNGAADDDELTRSTGGKRVPSRNALRPNKRGINKSIGRNAQSQRRSHGKAKQPSATTTGAKQLSRPAKDQVTYSRRSLQDKENDTFDAPDSTSSDSDRDVEDSTSNRQRQPYQRVVSAELIEQAKKFAEVDRWRMEFEDVTWEPDDLSSQFR